MSNLYLDGSIENAYHDAKLVFDSITDDDTFQTADSGLVFSYLDKIVQALERQVPKKVVKTKNIYGHNGYDYRCPICGGDAETVTGDSYLDYRLNFCDDCGQKLDWSDE